MHPRNWQPSGQNPNQNPTYRSYRPTGRRDEQFAGPSRDDWQPDRGRPMGGRPDQQGMGYDRGRPQHDQPEHFGGYGNHDPQRIPFGMGTQGHADPDRYGNPDRQDYGYQERQGTQGSGYQGGQDYPSRPDFGGNQGYTSQGYGSNQGYSGQSYGGQTYANQGSGNQGSGNQGYGTQGFGGQERFGQDFGRQGQFTPDRPDWRRDMGRDSGSFGSGSQWNQGIEGGQRPMMGKGPKGYARSDDRIREEICERLSEGHVDASDIEVSVHGGEVTLSGTVDDRPAKRLVEEIADGARGVKDIENKLKVRADSSTPITGSPRSEGADRSPPTQSPQQSQGAFKADRPEGQPATPNSNGSMSREAAASAARRL